jgi:hypothetical protein
MTPGENRSERSEARRKETAEARRVSKRPYVRPSVACQNLEHVVQGATGPRLDGVSGRIGKSQGGGG